MTNRKKKALEYSSPGNHPVSEISQYHKNAGVEVHHFYDPLPAIGRNLAAQEVSVRSILLADRSKNHVFSKYILQISDDVFSSIDDFVHICNTQNQYLGHRICWRYSL